MDFCKAAIIKLFNCGKLTVYSAEWYASQGYFLVCKAGKVIDIVSDAYE